MGASSNFVGWGNVWRFVDRELTPTDFAGDVIYAELSTGLLVAGGFTGLIVGLDSHAMISWIINPAFFARNISAGAKAFIALAGMSEGLIDGIGAVNRSPHLSISPDPRLSPVPRIPVASGLRSI